MSWHPKYAVHPGVESMIKWEQTLPEKTGRSMEEWITLVKRRGPKATAERREWLKREHGLGTNYAWHIVDRAEGRGEEDTDPRKYLATAVAYVDEMYSGGKAGLRPLHDALVKLGLSVGQDVKICPCKTIVPFYRHHVIAQIKPRTRTQIDFGFALGDMKAKGRLEDTGGFAKKDRITHRIPITRLEDIDEEVGRWLRVAYEKDA